MTVAPQLTDAPSLDGVLEACLYVNDLEAAERFYRDVLGLAYVSRISGRHLFLRCGGQMLFLFDPTATEVENLDAPFPVPRHGARGAGHICLHTDAVGVARWRDHLEAKGVAIESDFAWPNGARSIYFRDPAGNSLEIAERRLWFAVD